MRAPPTDSSPLTETAAGRGRVQAGVIAIALLGLALATYLVVHHGARDIVQALAGIGWGMVAIVIAHVAQVALSGRGWHAVGHVEHDAPVGVFILARWIREAVSGLLPLTQIGGEVVSIRIVALHGVGNGIAASSMIADLGAQIVSQALFTLLGLSLLLADGHQGPVVLWTVLGLVASVSVLPAFFFAQRRGLLRATENLFIRLADRFPAFKGSSLDGLHDSIHRIFRQPQSLVMSFHAHLLSWLLGAFEIWLILHFLGADVGLREALVIESLSQVIRSVAFAVPGGLGVMEGGFMLLGALYGLSPQTGLAMSLAKRVREVLLGVPALAVWQVIEGRRWWTRRRTSPTPGLTD
ncbi:MAG: lysylphosphatidylglycerol synthase domain-containing protein [Gammaproteobacteria bacterium]